MNMNVVNDIWRCCWRCRSDHWRRVRHGFCFLRCPEQTQLSLLARVALPRGAAFESGESKEKQTKHKTLMDNDQCNFAFANSLAEKAAKYMFDKEVRAKKELDALPSFLAEWWKDWKKRITNEAEYGVDVYKTTVELPRSRFYMCKPTEDQIRAALPDELKFGFAADQVVIHVFSGSFDIKIGVSWHRAAALKRMREECDNDNGCKLLRKKSRADQSVEQEKAVYPTTAALEEKEPVYPTTAALEDSEAVYPTAAALKDPETE